MAELKGNDFLYRNWPSSAPAKAVLLLVHGLGAHTARWDFLAAFFAARGFPGYALELRGFGRTPERPRGHIGSFRAYDRDLLELRRLIDAEHPGSKVFLLGESMGGLIVFNLAAGHADRFAGQILISPSFKNGMKFPPSAYAILASQYWIRPRRTVAVPFTSAMCTRDRTYQAIMDANPDEVREASLKLLMGILGEQRRAKKSARSSAVPALFLIPGDDRLVDERAGYRVYDRFGPADKALLEYPAMRHALSIELERERVFEDILGWLEQRI
jgi:alpha-beta hydrolase superfamily lysophospholipase